LTEETHAAAYVRLKQIADSLTEVFDSCQIVVTLQDGDESAVFTAGSGSFYARWGSLRELVLQWDEFTREEARQSAVIEEDGDTPPDGEESHTA
jgi:hypothetical protein